MSREELRTTIAMQKETIIENINTILSLEERVEHLKFLVESREQDIEQLERDLKECKEAQRE